MKKNVFAPAPPMGFNTWDCYGAAVNEAQFLAMAEVQRDRLLPYGWEYAVIDIQWYEPCAHSAAYNPFADLCMDGCSRLVPAENRFPSAAGGKGFGPIAEKIHSMGMKFGIHMLRGIPRQAVHLNTPTVTPGVTARMIAHPYSLCPWNTDMYGVDPDAPGAQAYYDSVFEMYAGWGVDFVKVDDIANTEFKPAEPYSARREIEMIRRAIDRTGRKIVLSLSPGPAPLAEAQHLRDHADMWRMSGDFWDRTDALNRMFDLCAAWYPYVGDGCWPDCDMLPLGVLQLNDRDPAYRRRQSRFTKNEQVALMNLWCLFRSPLMMGGELTLLDEFTYSLLTNRDLLAIDQASSGNRPLQINHDLAVFTCLDADRRPVFGVFNRRREAADITVVLPLADTAVLEDIWTKERRAVAGGILTLRLGAFESRVFTAVSEPVEKE
ncbi:MAG: glycoside hydrolase family 27 protein [Clostridia bacterium]|nr:glycoside hydrolase family 27 protein [Clostridia bacterium]